MSYVTNVVLITGMLDDVTVYEYFNKKGIVLAQVDEYAGGSKSMEQNVYIGAFNHMDTENLVQNFKTARWKWPEEAFLYHQTEGGLAYTHQIFDKF